MPEFEEENINASPSENYKPSTDASTKPRTRRRSGGFKAELTPLSNTKVGEVNAAEALLGEKLSGQISSNNEKTPVRSEKTEVSGREKQAPRLHRDTNPQPSAKTLQAIAVVESRVAERQSKRDKKRNANHDRKPQNKKRNNKQRRNHSKEGLLEIIGGWISTFFGNNPKSAKKKSGQRRSQGRGRHSRIKGGNRNGQGRGRNGPKGRKRNSNGRVSHKRDNDAVS